MDRPLLPAAVPLPFALALALASAAASPARADDLAAAAARNADALGRTLLAARVEPGEEPATVVAVPTFGTSGGLAPDAGAVAAEAFAARLRAAAPGRTVLDRAALRDALGEQKLARTAGGLSASDPDLARTGARALVLGQVLGDGARVRVHSRLVLVPSGRILGQVQALADRPAPVGGPRLLGVAWEEAGADGGPRALVRLAFERGPDGWRPVDAARAAALPPRAYWAACAGGKRLGELATNLAAPDPSTPPGTHLPTEPVPWADPGVAVPGGRRGLRLHGPVVLASSEACADPAGWRPAVAPPDVRARLLAALVAEVKVQRCDGKGGWIWWDYGDGDVALSGAHVSRDGAWLAELTISAPRAPGGGPCEGVLGDGFSPQLLLAPPKGEARRLGSALRFVDAGDWDGDGEGEVLARSTRAPGQFTLYFRGLILSAESVPGSR